MVDYVHADGNHDYEWVSTEQADIDPPNKSENITKRGIVSTEELDESLTDSDSIQAVLDGLPYFIMHGGKISLADGTYQEQEITTGVHLANTDANVPPDVKYTFAIIGNESAPSNVVVGDGNDYLNVSIDAGSPRNVDIRGIDFNAKVQNRLGGMTVENCILRGSTSAGFDAALSGYQATTVIDNCTVERADHLAHAKDGHDIYITNCDGGAAGNIFRENGTATGSGGGGVWYDDSNTVEGTFPTAYVIERFDTPLSTDAGAHRWKKIGPSWSVDSGSPWVDLSASELVLPAGDATTQEISIPSSFTRGKVRFRLDPQSDPTTGGVLTTVVKESGSDYVTVQAVNNGDIHIQKSDGGSTTFVASDTSTWAGDSTPVDIVAESSRNIDGSGNDGYGVEVNGAAQQTATDTFLPAPSEIRIRSTTDSEVRIPYIIYE